MRVRLRDVAEEAGVSTATASLVLNDKADSIGAEARERVLNAAERLGYRPNALARGLRAQKTGTIGLFSHDVLTTPYAAAMIQGAQEVADELGYVLLLANVSDDPHHTAAGIGTLLDRQIDAAIYATMFHRGVVVPPQLNGTPTVFLDAFPKAGPDDDDFEASRRRPDFWCVVPDEYAGATAAVEHLIAAGHRRIAWIDEVQRPLAALLREQAYHDALARHGIERDPTLEIVVFGTTHGAYPPVMELLEQPDRPTALFCFNDRIATGVYHAAHKLGLRVPLDLSVVGFDNQELIAEAIDPMLTTVQLPHYEMGRWAMQQVADLLAPQMVGTVDAPDEEMRPRIQLMPCPLVERQSVAPPSVSQ